MLDKILMCYRADVALCHVSVITQHLDQMLELCEGKYLNHDDCADIIIDCMCAILQEGKQRIRKANLEDAD